MPLVNALGEITEEDLAGFTMQDLKCRGCSGYGNCGYRMYRLQQGKPVSVCRLRRDELIKKRDAQD